MNYFYGFLGIIGFIFVIAIIMRICGKINGNKAMKEQDIYIRQNGIHCTRDLKYVGAFNRCRFIVDDENQAIYAASQMSNDRFVRIPFREIMGLFVENETFNDGSAAGAVIGGLFAGNVGAYLGATRGNEYSGAFRAVISRQNYQDTRFVFTFFENARLTASSPDYQNAVEFTNEMRELIKVIRIECLTAPLPN